MYPRCPSWFPLLSSFPSHSYEDICTRVEPCDTGIHVLKFFICTLPMSISLCRNFGTRVHIDRYMLTDSTILFFTLFHAVSSGLDHLIDVCGKSKSFFVHVSTLSGLDPWIMKVSSLGFDKKFSYTCTRRAILVSCTLLLTIIFPRNFSIHVWISMTHVSK